MGIDTSQGREGGVGDAQRAIAEDGATPIVVNRCLARAWRLHIERGQPSCFLRARKATNDNNSASEQFTHRCAALAQRFAFMREQGDHLGVDGELRGSPCVLSSFVHRGKPSRVDQEPQRRLA